MITLIQCPWHAGAWNSLRLNWVQIVTLVPESGLEPESFWSKLHVCDDYALLPIIYKIFICGYMLIRKWLFIPKWCLVPYQSLRDKVLADTAPIAQVLLAYGRAFFPTRAWSPTSPAPIPVSLLWVAETPCSCSVLLAFPSWILGLV